MHRQCKPRCIFDTERLDYAIRRARLNYQIGRQTLHPLCMQRIDPHASRACEARQHSVRLQSHIVRGCVLHGQRLVVIITMIQQARHFVQSLRECTAHSNIDFLKAATDAEYRNAGADRTRDERQRRRIARGIMQGTGNARCSIVPMRFYI